jgi:hypothetical protein
LWGGSAGGTFASKPEFVQPDGFIKAVITTYPGLLIEANRENHLCGLDTSNSIFGSQLDKMKPGKVVTSAGPPSRMDIAFLLVQLMRIRDFFGQEDRLCP